MTPTPHITTADGEQRDVQDDSTAHPCEADGLDVGRDPVEATADAQGLSTIEMGSTGETSGPDRQPDPGPGRSPASTNSGASRSTGSEGSLESPPDSAEQAAEDDTNQRTLSTWDDHVSRTGSAEEGETDHAGDQATTDGTVDETRSSRIEAYAHDDAQTSRSAGMSTSSPERIADDRRSASGAPSQAPLHARLTDRDTEQPGSTHDGVATTEAADPSAAASQETDSEVQCPDCGTTLQSEDHELVCSGCGLVVADLQIDRGPEWRQFSDEEGQNRSRVGAPVTVARHDKGLSTTFQTSTDGMGRSLSGGTQAKFERLKKHHRRMVTGDSKDKARISGFTDIRRITKALDLPKTVRDRACELFRKAHDAELLIGSSIESYAAAAIYAACRVMAVPRLLGDIAPHTSADSASIRSDYMMMNQEFGLRTAPPTPREFLPRLLTRIDAEIAPAQRKEMLQLAEEANDKTVSQGRNPASFAAAIVYYVTPDAATQTALAEIGDVSAASIQHNRDSLVEMIDERTSSDDDGVDDTSADDTPETADAGDSETEQTDDQAGESSPDGPARPEPGPTTDDPAQPGPTPAPGFPGHGPDPPSRQPSPGGARLRPTASTGIGPPSRETSPKQCGPPDATEKDRRAGCPLSARDWPGPPARSRPIRRPVSTHSQQGRARPRTGETRQPRSRAPGWNKQVHEPVVEKPQPPPSDASLTPPVPAPLGILAPTPVPPPVDQSPTVDVAATTTDSFSSSPSPTSFGPAGQYHCMF